MQKCEVCGHECDNTMKFCPECGNGLLISKDKGHNLAMREMYAPVFPAVFTALAILEPANTIWEALTLAVVIYLFYLVTAVIAQTIEQRYYGKKIWGWLGTLAAALIIAFVLNYMFGLFPIIDEWL